MSDQWWTAFFSMVVAVAGGIGLQVALKLAGHADKKIDEEAERRKAFELARDQDLTDLRIEIKNLRTELNGQRNETFKEQRRNIDLEAEIESLKLDIEREKSKNRSRPEHE